MAPIHLHKTAVVFSILMNAWCSLFDGISTCNCFNDSNWIENNWPYCRHLDVSFFLSLCILAFAFGSWCKCRIVNAHLFTKYIYVFICRYLFLSALLWIHPLALGHLKVEHILVLCLLTHTHTSIYSLFALSFQLCVVVVVFSVLSFNI